MELLITCHRGLESIAERELREFGVKVKEKLFGKLIAEGSVKDIIILNYGARTINRLILLLFSGDFENLNSIEKISKSLPWEDFISNSTTFGVESKRIGKHDFNSMDVAKVVGKSVIERVEKERGFKPKVFLNSPDVIIYAEVNRKRLFLGINTSGESLHMRGYRVYQHPAPISPSLASSLLFVADKPSSILDPFCGSGTIPIENALMNLNMPKIWRSFAFEKIQTFKEIFEEVKKKWKMKDEETLNYGFDKFIKHVKGAMKNAESAGVSSKTEFWVGNAENIESYRGEFQAIVTNPPYGLRVASKRIIEKIYDNFARNVAELGRKLVLITGEPYFLISAEKAKLELKEKISIIYGSLPSLILVYD